MKDKIMKILNQNNESLANEIEKLIPKPQTLKLPPDKIVLSAKLFSRIVNNLSYAESAGVAEQGIVHELVDDVKNNQDMIEKRKTVSKPVETKKRYYSTDGLDELLSLIRKDLTI